jgi:hypothetical protein
MSTAASEANAPSTSQKQQHPESPSESSHNDVSEDLHSSALPAVLDAVQTAQEDLKVSPGEKSPKEGILSF